MIIGITGVFGSGKSVVSRLFAKYGYRVINADEIGHKLLNKKSIKNKIIKEFGKSVLTKNKIDRKKLKKIVFYNHKALIKLNKIIHPAIINEIKTIIKKSKNKKIIVDGALLIETKCLKLFDRLIVVKIGKGEQLKRILLLNSKNSKGFGNSRNFQNKKKKYNKKEIESIIKSQLSQREKLKYADIVVDNSKSLKHTKKEVKKIIKTLK